MLRGMRSAPRPPSLCQHCLAQRRRAWHWKEGSVSPEGFTSGRALCCRSIHAAFWGRKYLACGRESSQQKEGLLTVSSRDPLSPSKRHGSFSKGHIPPPRMRVLPFQRCQEGSPYPACPLPSLGNARCGPSISPFVLLFSLAKQEITRNRPGLGRGTL